MSVTPHAEPVTRWAQRRKVTDAQPPTRVPPDTLRPAQGGAARAIARETKETHGSPTYCTFDPPNLRLIAQKILDSASEFRLRPVASSAVEHGTEGSHASSVKGMPNHEHWVSASTPHRRWGGASSKLVEHAWVGSKLFAATVFCLAGVGKFLVWHSYLASAVKVAHAVGVDDSVARTLAIVLPFVEIAAGATLIAGRGVFFHFGAWSSLGLSLLIAWVRVRVATTGVVFRCPCFGELLPIDRYDWLGTVVALGTCLSASAMVIWGDPVKDNINTGQPSMDGPSMG